MSGNHPGSRSYLLVPPHCAFGVLNGFGAMLAGANPDRVLDSQDDDLAVAHPARPGSHAHLVHYGLDDFRTHHRLDLQARPEGDVDGRSAVLLRITPLSATPFHLR